MEDIELLQIIDRVNRAKEKVQVYQILTNYLSEVCDGTNAHGCVLAYSISREVVLEVVKELTTRKEELSRLPTFGKEKQPTQLKALPGRPRQVKEKQKIRHKSNNTD